MVNFANLTDVCQKKHKPYLRQSKEKTSSHSSSGSLRAVKREQKKSSDNYYSSQSPNPISQNGGNQYYTAPLAEYNQNYRLPSTHPAYTGTGLHPYHDSTSSDQKSTFDELMGIDIIKKVMKNNWCKKILRNILLEEYLDGMIQQRMGINSITVPQTGGNRSDNHPVNESDWLNEKYFGIELRTILVAILGIIVLKYLFDFFNRGFR